MDKKLRTLEDLPKFFPENSGRTTGDSFPTMISYIQLRAEAVKWVKHFDKMGENYTALSFINFFNLTGEDLK